MNRFFCFFIFCFLFSQDVLLNIDDEKILTSSFYLKNPRSSWVSFDSSQQAFALDSFVKKELIYYNALSTGLDKDPNVFIKLKKRKDQLLVNAFYEKSVASPFVDLDYINQTNRFLFDRVYVYHILFGFKGSSLRAPQTKTKEQALALAEQTKKTIEDSLVVVDFSQKDSVFSFFASSSSSDPSVAQNKGEIGWVSWGQVMPSFQASAFSLPVLTVSEPVLTEFGYHLIFVKKRGFSDYFYYDKKYSKDLVYKFGLQSVPVDSLRGAATKHDSLFINENLFILNHAFVDLVFSKINQKTKVEKLRGGKKPYIDWLKEINKKDVLFVFKNKGFGLGWFINSLSSTPATRVSTLQNKDDFIFLLKSFLIQEGAVSLAREKNLHLSPVFVEDFKQQSKNILLKHYEKKVLSSVLDVDSLLVSEMYNKGIFNGDYIKPRQVVFSEIRVSERSLADSLFVDFSTFNDFDKLIKLFKGSLKKPISFGGGGLIGEAAFSLKEGEVSAVIENLNKTFSLVRVERFLEEEPFTLDRVFSQIERKIIKEKQDSIKKHLGEDLFKTHFVKTNREALSF